MLIAINRLLKPTHMRNSMANTPSKFRGLKLGANAKPIGIAMSRMMNAWNIDRSVAENTLLRMITERETGVLRTLLRKPKRRSHTTDMPLNMVVKTAVKPIMPTAMKLM